MIFHTIMKPFRLESSFKISHPLQVVQLRSNTHHSMQLKGRVLHPMKGSNSVIMSLQGNMY